MTRLALLTAMVLGLLGSLAAGNALADDCVALGGIDSVAECTINSPVVAEGAFSLEKTLHITPTGKITVPAKSGGNTLTISICTALATLCDLVMDVGAQISGNVTGTGVATGTGATITINASGDIVLHGSGAAGASITSNQTAGSCAGGRAGNINLNADFDISVEAGASVTANGRCPAGNITIISAQGSVDIDGLVESKSLLSGTGSGRPGGGPITIIGRCDLSIDGTVRSQGQDPGADLIHLEGGCNVTITGLVESFGAGHGIPSNPPNHCTNASHPSGTDTACVEIVAGDNLLITNTAEIRADTGNGGGAGSSWIDIFTRGPITVIGRTSGIFSVHANGNASSNDTGGDVTVKSRDSSITASGLAFQANATNGGGHGGAIVLESNTNLDLSGATVQARGATSGTTPQGGSIAGRSFNGAIVGSAASVLDVTGGNPADGTVDLTACQTIAFPPGTVLPAGALVNKTPGACTGAPSIPLPLPDCLCGTQPGDGICPEDNDKLITRVVDPCQLAHGVLPVHATLQAAVNQAASGEIIGMFTHTCDANPAIPPNTIENVVTPEKTLIITQCTGARIVAADGALPVIRIATHPPNKITIIGLDTVGGSAGFQIDHDAHDLKSVRATGAGPVVGVPFSGAGILVLGNKNRVSWNALKQCTFGLVANGNNNDLRGGTIESNASHGVWFDAAATGNKLQGATIKSNGGDGVLIGAGAFKNTINSNKMDLNGLNGVEVLGSANVIKGNQAGTGAGLGNNLDGFKVTGPGNQLTDNKANANKGDGFDVSGGIVGSANVLKGNQSNLGGSGGNRENTGAEYRGAPTIVNGGGNKADGIAVPSAAKCLLSFPVGVCE